MCVHKLEEQCILNTTELRLTASVLQCLHIKFGVFGFDVCSSQLQAEMIRGCPVWCPWWKSSWLHQVCTMKAHSYFSHLHDHDRRMVRGGFDRQQSSSYFQGTEQVKPERNSAFVFLKTTCKHVHQICPTTWECNYSPNQNYFKVFPRR